MSSRFMLGGALFLLAAAAFPTNLPAEEHSFPRLLFLSSYHPGYPSVEKQVSGVRRGLADSGFDTVEYHLDIEHLDTKRFPAGELSRKIRINLEERLSVLKEYDIVFCADDNALEYATDETEQLRRSSLVFLGINDPESVRKYGADPGITGVAETIPMEDNLNLITALHPKAPYLAVISDASVTGRALLRNLENAHAPGRHLPLENLSLAEYRYDDVLESIGNLGPSIPVLLLTGYIDSEGTVLELTEVVGLLDRAAEGPLYHVQKWGIGMGVFAGVVIDQEEQGYLAGQMAGRILAGTDPVDIPPIASVPGRTAVDWSRLGEYGLRPSDLPADTVYINRPGGWWKLPGSIRLIIIASIGAVLTLVIYLAAAARRNARKVVRRNKTIESAIRTIDLQQRQASIGDFIVGLAHELNTPIGIGITAVTYMNGILESLEEGSRTFDAEALDDLTQATRLSTRNMRKAAEIIRVLRDTSRRKDNDNVDFVEPETFIRELLMGINTELKRRKIEVKLDFDAHLAVSTRPQTLRQVVLGLLWNAIDHAFCRDRDESESRLITITGRLQQRDGNILISIADNGCGIPEKLKDRLFQPFSTSNRGGKHHGLGLYLVYTDVKNNLSGTIVCYSEDNIGTRFELNLPDLEMENPDV